jgi:ABC-type transport system involved in multi-copper enzyme maturation permease subunit
MIFRHWLRENAVLAIGYALLLAINAGFAVLYWPDLRDNFPELIKFVPFEPLQQFVRAWDEYGFWAYFGVQQFCKGAGVFGVAAAGLMGSGLIARDVDNRTAELLLSRPVSRGRVLFSRWSAGALLLVIPLFLTTALGVALAPRVNEAVPWSHALQGAAYVSLFVLCVYTLTVALSARCSHQLKACILVLGFMLLQFAFYLIKVLWDWSLYNLIDLDPLMPIASGTFPWRNALAMAGAALTFYGVAWLQFEKRDF